MMSRVKVWLVLACASVLAACGGGGGSGDGPPPTPVTSIYAGLLPAPGSDGIGAAAQFSGPRGVAQDAGGTIYVADTGNHTVRKLTRQGLVTTLAGAARQSGSTDGTGASARFLSPQGLAVDAAGNVFVADSGNQTVRKISPAGVVTTLAGVAGQAGSTDGGSSVARLDTPKKLALDGAGGLYVLSDTAVRKVAPDGSVSTFLPPGASSPAAGMRFSGVAVDAAGNVFIAQAESTGFSDTTRAGSGTVRKFSAQGQGLPLGSAADGVLNVVFAVDLAADRSGNLVAAQNGNTFNGTIAFSGVFHRGVLRIAADGSIIVLAGGGGSTRQPFSIDGPAAVASFADPSAVSVGPDGLIAVVEAATGGVRIVDAQGTVSTLAGFDGGGNVDGEASVARFEKPQGIAAAADGSLYVVDAYKNGSLRRISPSGVVSTVAQVASDTANVAIGPDGAVYISGLLKFRFFIEYSVRQIALAAGSQAPLPVSYAGSSTAFTVDAAGNLIVNELAPNPAGAFPAPGQLTAVAPDGTRRVLGTGINAAALAADASGTVYFATTQGTVGSLSPSGQVTIRAGVSGQFGDQDGSGSNARFRSPNALAVDSAGNLYVGDFGRVRKVTPAGVVTTIADLGTATIRGLTWVAGSLYATAGNAVVRIAPVS